MNEKGGDKDEVDEDASFGGRPQERRSPRKGEHVCSCIDRWLSCASSILPPLMPFNPFIPSSL